MATTTIPEVTKKAAPVTLTGNAVTKVKEIMGQQNPVPAGLRIGRVTNVGKKPVGLFLSAEVAPAVDFSSLDEVSVVVAALTLSAVGRTRFTPTTWDRLENIWQQLGFWANSLILRQRSQSTFHPPAPTPCRGSAANARRATSQ